MNRLFPYDNVVAGILVLFVGFVFHWIGQLLSVLRWDWAVRLGLQDKHAPPEYKVYEHGIAVADVAIGWVYGLAGVGLILGTPWGLKLAWVPGAILMYHGVSFWFWSRNQRLAGHRLMSNAMRVGWFLANVGAGGLSLWVAWHGG